MSWHMFNIMFFYFLMGMVSTVNGLSLVPVGLFIINTIQKGTLTKWTALATIPFFAVIGTIMLTDYIACNTYTTIVVSVYPLVFGLLIGACISGLIIYGQHQKEEEKKQKEADMRKCQVFDDPN